MLVVTCKDVDTTGKSYYGETALFFMDIYGNACNVGSAKKGEGPMHACEWLPNEAVQGYGGFLTLSGRMPAALTLYDKKAEPVYSFGEANVNSIYLNPYGTLVAVAGFGNLSGEVQVWNLQQRTLISHFEAAHTTAFDWTSDALHMVAATHYERLKVDNGFKIFDYLGKQLHHELCKSPEASDVHTGLGQHLYSIVALPNNGSWAEPTISPTAKGKILAEQPSTKYVPPFLRQENKGDQLEPPPFGAKKPFVNNAKQPLSKGNKVINNGNRTSLVKQQPGQTKQPPALTNEVPSGERRLKNLNKKLAQIQQLKAQVAEGKTLEKNQLDKIQNEDKLLQEISALSISVK